MLFNSYLFIFVFLPIALLGYHMSCRLGGRAIIQWLALASLIFYGYWNPSLLYVLVTSVAINYVAGGLISRRIPNRIDGRVWVTVAVALNLLVLCYFKYLIPSMNFIAAHTGLSAHWQNMVLPLGISFFTFTQIAFLVDLYQGIAKQQAVSSYLLFVTFFPHLIAGPILHHKDMMPQFDKERRSGLRLDDVSIGLSWFILGLFKKVVLADQLAKAANPVFNTHAALTTGEAWTGCLAYCLQLYFDFSGYSDMALGLARMFSIDFPLNFNSPFKSASIIDFWQRWHMTLSNYIMSYVFTPLQQAARRRRVTAGRGVSRKDLRNPSAFLDLIGVPMMTSLLIAGVWHGAGSQFLIYGLLHGSYLTINHGWRMWVNRPGHSIVKHAVTARVVHVISLLTTLFFVMVSFVFFRSQGPTHALAILCALSGLNVHGTSTLPAMTHSVAFIMAAGFIIVWGMPNTQQILTRFRPSLNREAWNAPGPLSAIAWAPRVTWAFMLGCLFFFTLSQMEEPSTFLYFQF